MKLIYSNQNGSITNSTGTWQITTAPQLGFAYDGIFYDDEDGHALKYIGEGSTFLNDAEKVAIKAFLAVQIAPPIVAPTQAQIDARVRAEMPALSAWQIRKALDYFSLRSAVENTISSAPQAMKDAWQYASEFKRDDSLLLASAQALGLTDTQLDQMFAIGVTL